MNTDARRGLSAQLSSSANANESGGWSRQFGATLTMKPASEFVFVIGPQVNRTLTTAQYIQTVTDATATGTYGRRDVFGVLDQTQVSMTIRANAVVTPHVSLQVYAQPLLASGSYGAFRELARPRTYDFLQYGSASSSIAYDSAARRFTVDPDGSGPAGSFGFDNPDFNLKSLRVNSVFRWEFRPGSTFYAVWTRQQLDNGQPGDFSLGRDARALLSARGDDVFLVKFAYWIAR
jgi:hypothetical protein